MDAPSLKAQLERTPPSKGSVRALDLEDVVGVTPAASMFERREECVKSHIRDDSSVVLPGRTRRDASGFDVEEDLAGVCARCLRRGSAHGNNLLSGPTRAR
jgi:hypothetical protein